MKRELDPKLASIEVVPQDVARVSSSSSATGSAQRRSATAYDLGDEVEIRVRDNGTGMPPEDYTSRTAAHPAPAAPNRLPARLRDRS